MSHVTHFVWIGDFLQPNCQRVHLHLESKGQDELCCAAQTLLRWLCHGAERQVLGLVSAQHIVVYGRKFRRTQGFYFAWWFPSDVEFPIAVHVLERVLLRSQSAKLIVSYFSRKRIVELAVFVVLQYDLLSAMCVQCVMYFELWVRLWHWQCVCFSFFLLYPVGYTQECR